METFPLDWLLINRSTPNTSHTITLTKTLNLFPNFNTRSVLFAGNRNYPHYGECFDENGNMILTEARANVAY